MPSGGNLHISKTLSNVAVEYKNNAYIAQEALGTVSVQKESDLYYTFNRDFRIPEARRADGAASNQITWGVSTSSYVLQRYSLSDVVTDRSRDNSDTINLDMQTTEFLMDKILLNIEAATADLLFTTGTWGLNATLNSATAWRSPTTTSVPVQNILSGTSAIVSNSGRRPNTLILGYTSYDALKLNSDITGRIQYVERAIANKEVMASLFDIQTIHVGEAVRDTGTPGVSENLGYIWGPDALLCYLEKSPGMRKLSAAYMFQKSDVATKKWRDEKVEGDYIEVNAMMRPYAVATSCAFFFKAVAT